VTAVSGYTWDGLPVAPDEPNGAAILVRRTGTGEYLILHRAHRGPGYEGDWAWTPPSGSRLPGEPVLAAALRELAEETGLQVDAADLHPLDLSGAWAHFGLDVTSSAQPRLDAEHDRFEWLSAAEAIARCSPDTVADGVRRAESVLAVGVSFRPLAVADLPALVGWQHAPHAVRWFPERLDEAAAVRKYAPRIAGKSPVRVHVAVVGGRDAGFVQHYPVSAGSAEQAGPDDVVGIDYAIGISELTGRGVGPRLIWSYLRDVVLPAHPAARYAVGNPDVDNVRSIRALEKAGFVRAGVLDCPGEPGPEQQCVLDLVKFFGRPER
jgi:8-oxo-dGTP pyrophosphatase MutT (NUDIX family)/RimJ/RimL family protein N-acetyltransferase